MPAAEKHLHWVTETNRRWDGYLEFQRNPQPMLEWFAGSWRLGREMQNPLLRTRAPGPLPRLSSGPVGCGPWASHRRRLTTRMVVAGPESAREIRRPGRRG
jgi:hypothetical protein